MNQRSYTPLGGIRQITDFQAHLESLGLLIPCDSKLEVGERSVFREPLTLNDREIGNRFCIHPMEGWDGSADGQPTEHTARRWRHFGASGAKLIWGGEAVAVRQNGRANPHQLLLTASTQRAIADLRDTLVTTHRDRFGSNADADLFVGLQLTHSGRYARPRVKDRPEP